MDDTMSKEKAADLLDNLVGMVEDTSGNDYDTALTMGIKALKADAVEVVRCKDCVKCQVDTIFNQYWCGGERVLPNGFCNHGRRKNG